MVIIVEMTLIGFVKMTQVKILTCMWDVVIIVWANVFLGLVLIIIVTIRG
jgi:hypothetical protein